MWKRLRIDTSADIVQQVHEWQKDWQSREVVTPDKDPKAQYLGRSMNSP